MTRSDKKVKKFKVSSSAIENWARLNNLDLLFDSARQKLLTELEGRSPNIAPPDWMSSSNPEVKLWINLDNKISLTVKESPDPGFQYLISNAVGPKSIRKQAKQLGVPLKRSSFSEEEITEGEQLTSEELSQKIIVSEHSIEQFNERLKKDYSKQQLLKIISQCARVVFPPPFWADASRRNQPVIIADYLGQEVAFPLAKNEQGWTITTSIPENWSKQGLYDRSGLELLETIYLPSQYDNSAVRQEITESEQVTSDPKSTFIKTKKMIIYLRPADATQRQQRTSGKPWFIESIEYLHQ
jgi:hypothetical protein